MVCPNCKKVFICGLPAKALKRAQFYHKQGWSLRAIATALKTEGYEASYSSLSRYFKGA